MSKTLCIELRGDHVFLTFQMAGSDNHCSNLVGNREMRDRIGGEG